MRIEEPWLPVLPDGWAVRRLGTLGTLTKCRGGSRDDNVDSGIPVIRYGDVYTKFDMRIERAPGYVSEVAASAYTPLPTNGIVFAASGESAEEIGKAVLSRLPQPAVVGGDAILFEASDDVDPTFLTYALQSAPLVGQKTVRSTGFTVVHINAGRLKTLRLALPPLARQRLIADFLDRETARIDTLIDEQQRLIQVLRERRQAGIEVLVTTGGRPEEDLVATDLRWAPRVPRGWVVGNIRRFAEMKSGHTPSRSKQELWRDCTIPWFTLADVWQLREGRRIHLGETKTLISELGLANSAAELLPAGTVVLSRTASVGFTGIMPVPMATSQDYWNWVCGPDLLPEYLMWTFRAMWQEFKALMIGSTHKTIYQPVAAAIQIVVPPIEEQADVVRVLGAETARIDTLVEGAKRLIDLSRERRAALITAAVTGEIDVRRGGA